MIEWVGGNLLEAKVEALVNTVNTVGVMGKGIALQFKKAFPENDAAYRRACQLGKLAPGDVLAHQAGGIVLPRYILNVATKEHWRGRSRMEWIDKGLVRLVEEVRALKIRSIAVPPLGCGNGGLAWSDVKPRIERAFRALPDVRVLAYEPNGAPAPERMPDRTKKPEMTVSRAALLALMQRYLVPGYDYLLSNLEVQKLSYFLQEAGQSLKLQYSRSHYGPYADNLRHALSHLESHYISGYGDGANKPDTPIELLPGAADEAEQFLAGDPTVHERFDRVSQLIEGFETPLGMELLATVHWLATHEKETGADRDSEAAVRGVQTWSPRKAKLMKPTQIRAAWARLHEQKWV
jgi:O-acetyl-ADP-ribose deacetylase (regulator of RNase III)